MKRALFVCVHNAGRSQMAEAIFNSLAEARSLPVRAASAGTDACDRVNPIVVQAMREMDISLDGCRPKQLAQRMADAADRIITMGCGVNAEACPARLLVTEDWGLDDPASQPIEAVRAIRDEIRRRVELLLTDMLGAP